MKTPFEMWHQKKPEIGHIRTYGCLVHVHIPSETRAKMDKVSHQGVLVGFQSSRQYKVYNPNTRTVGVHTSVKFFEDWPGGPLLSAPAEPGEWEVDTADPDYEPDQDSNDNVDNSDSTKRDSSDKEPAGTEPASGNQQNDEVVSVYCSVHSKFIFSLEIHSTHSTACEAFFSVLSLSL